MKSPAPHLGLARKYRPQTFEDVIGQEACTVTLKNAVAAGKPAHAYLFFGPRGIGKTTTARILAKALNCQKGPTAEPCGKCGPCAEIAASSDLDVLELDAATHTQVEKIREMILETVNLAPARDRHKIFIIDEVHMLSTSSFNALLKTLEEPPAHVVFILATTEAAKIPPTIVSRCQRFRFRPIPVDVLKERLAELAKREKIKAEPAALELLARAAGGALRDAVGLLDQAQAFGEAEVTVAQVTDLLGTLPDDALRGLAQAILGKDAPALAERLDKLLEEGYDPAQIARDLRDRFQAAFLHRLGVKADLDAPWTALAAPHGPQAFAYLVGRMNRALEQLRSEDSARLVLEQALFGALEPAVDLAQWVERLEALERRLAAGGGSPPLASSPRPAAVRPAAAALAPASAPVPRTEDSVRARVQGPAENVWPAVIQQLREEKPGLAAYLETARLVQHPNGEWRLVFRRSFELEQAKRSQSVIEDKLASITGKSVRLGLEIGTGRATTATASGPAADDEPASDEPSADPAVEDPAVKKVLEVFPGKVKQIKTPGRSAPGEPFKKKPGA
ncbi:MAG: DNA polymerase III subunit gamma/tau [Elusimicrobia bacterium]|nr:DNA polymerase III subunit gamma/tau [Elusimicrobiota bacterium]